MNLCANAAHALEVFTSAAQAVNGLEKLETFSGSITETIESLINQAVAKIGKESATMTMEERIRTVQELDASGVFKIKGGIDLAALRLGVSKCTVYNYLKRAVTNNERRPCKKSYGPGKGET